jgi:MFS superfamily sulfate permease-like transporter
MSITARLGIRSIWLSMAEIIVFLGFSAGYFVGVPKAWAVFAQTGMPAWMWIVVGLAYLLIVTVWWSPTDEASDNSELIAFAVVLALVLIVGGIAIEVKFDGAVSKVVRTFWEIMRDGGQSG